MSKSLKNFITIDVRLMDILQRFTPRQLRLAFLSQLWNAKVDFSESLMTGEVKTTESTSTLNESKLVFRSALCDSFNTPKALKVLRDVISHTNVYIDARTKSPNVILVEQSARWVGDMLWIFGLGEGEKLELGWGQETTSDVNSANVSIYASTISLSQPCLH
ncbi:hypothetical protein J3R83DRAFT_5820 [Lanmaoa asiatica]|nr:hypothetical protein J3R83DRAFT_5820 [Lanmaoa asiatica]